MFFNCSFLTKFRVEVAMRVAFFGCVDDGFFLSRDLTVLAKAFSLLSRLLLGCSTLREDSLSLAELYFTLSSVSYWVAQTLFWISFSRSMILRSLSRSYRWRDLFMVTIF